MPLHIFFASASTKDGAGGQAKLELAKAPVSPVALHRARADVCPFQDSFEGSEVSFILGFTN
jgi:hypothetical protein